VPAGKSPSPALCGVVDTLRDLVYTAPVEYADDLIDDDEHPPFEISVTVDGDEHVLVVQGDLDLATTPQLLDALKALPQGAALRLDLSGVAFIDSVGLKALLTAQQRFGDGLTLPRTPDHIVNLLTLVGIKKLLHLVP